MNTPKISVGQTASLLIISRVIVSLTYSPSYFTGGYSTADLLALVISLPIVALEYLPVLWLFKKGGSVITLSYGRATALGHGTAVLYSAFLLWIAAVSVARFDVFISTSVFSNYIFYGFMLPAVLAFFGALRGVEGIGRASLIFSTLIILAVLLLFFVAVPSFDLTNLYNPFLRGNRAVFDSTLSILSRSSEAAILCVLMQFVREKIGKIYLIYSAVSLFTVFVALMTVVLVVGDFSFITMFPYDSAAGNVSDWTFLDLEPMLIFCWIIGVFIKCSLCICLAGHCLERIIKNRIVNLAVCSAFVMAAAFFLGRNIQGFGILFDPYIQLAVIFTFTFLLPCTVGIFGRKRV